MIFFPISQATDVLVLLGKVAAYALNLTGIFYFQVIPPLRPGILQNESFFE